MFIIPFLATFSLFTNIASLIVIVTALFSAGKWVVVPHIDKLLDTKINPLVTDIQSIKTTIDRELQPNGTPVATKIAVIEQKIKDIAN